MNVKDFLKRQGVAFKVIPHEQAFTAQEVAAREHVTGHKFAKTVIVKGNGDAYMLVLPASRHVDFGKASQLVGRELTMASEAEMKKLFPDCEVGAEPPFGSQYGLKTYLDETLTRVDEIVFRAGRHDETVQMKMADYRKLENPTVGSFAIAER